MMRLFRLRFVSLLLSTMFRTEEPFWTRGETSYKGNNTAAHMHLGFNKTYVDELQSACQFVLYQSVC